MILFIVLLLLACFQGLSAIQWISAYDNTTRTCSGCNLTLGWDYRLEPGETVNDIKWIYVADIWHRPSLMASYISGYFHSVPLYSNRLTHLSDGKVVLSGVTKADTGTYVVEVINKQTTGVSMIRRDLLVTVTDPSVYSHNVLSVKMDYQAVADDDGNLHVRLTCGPIAWRGEPPVDVVWTTPSEAKLNSTGYENDYFYLMLDNPVVAGVYACVLPASAIPALCLRAGDPLTRQATVTVDSTSARLAVLESNLQHITHQLQDVKKRNFNLTHQLEDLTQQLQDVKKDNFDLSKQLQDVRTEQDQCRVEVGNNTGRMRLLEDDFSQYRNIGSTHVGFHATLDIDITTNDGDPVKFSVIFYNDGDAYDSTTGQFTAPVDGTYFFIFSISPVGSEQFSSCALVVGSNVVAWVWTSHSDYYNYVTGHAVLHVGKGTTVWVQSLGNGFVFSSWSSFSGFLIRADL